jgi:hypothetical protein
MMWLLSGRPWSRRCKQQQLKCFPQNPPHRAFFHPHPASPLSTRPRRTRFVRATRDITCLNSFDVSRLKRNWRRWRWCVQHSRDFCVQPLRVLCDAQSLRLRIPIFRKQKWLERLCRTCCNMRLTQRRYCSAFGPMSVSLVHHPDHTLCPACG